MTKTETLLSLAILALCCGAARADDLDKLLSDSPPDGQAIDAAGTGVHSVSASSAPVGRVTDANMGKKKLVDDAEGQGLSATGATPAASSKAGPAKTSAGGSGAAAEPALWSILPAKDRDLQWETFERLGDLSAAHGHVGAHGKAPLSKGRGISVGFLTGPVNGSGHCSLVDSPAVPGWTEGCTYDVWISSGPHGPPLNKTCAATGAMVDAGVLFWHVGKLDGTCAVAGGTKYYCNVAGCAGVVGAPLGVNDYTREEGIAMSEGHPCTYGLMFGHFRNGVCTDDNGNTTPPPDNRPPCTNEAMKTGNECHSCPGLMPVNCDGKKLVVDCRTACK